MSLSVCRNQLGKDLELHMSSALSVLISLLDLCMVLLQTCG